MTKKELIEKYSIDPHSRLLMVLKELIDLELTRSEFDEIDRVLSDLQIHSS